MKMRDKYLVFVFLGETLQWQYRIPDFSPLRAEQPEC